MPAIKTMRPVLLTAPYGPADGNLEVMVHLPLGLRTTGLIEICLDDGTTGLGEAYLAVFAPEVFLAIARLLAPLVVGTPIEAFAQTVRTLELASGYWSHQGAARHVLGAVEIALRDCDAQARGVPLWRALGGTLNRAMPAYASGGDSIDPAHMAEEIGMVASLGCKTLKVRARAHQADKAIWCQRAGAEADVDIAVDMTQNLAMPSQVPAEIQTFLDRIRDDTGNGPAFIEEIQGPRDIGKLPGLRRSLGVPVAGGEIVTTPDELGTRIKLGCYDIVQPDATVIGGVGPVLEVLAGARAAGVASYVHCWGAGVGMLANYHAALAGDGDMLEWPLPAYPLREALWTEPIKVEGGHVRLSDRPGLGVRLTPEIEARYPFRSEASYNCIPAPGRVREGNWR